MIKITDNFLTKEEFIGIQEYCEQEFKIVNVGGKLFSVLQTPNWMLSNLQIPNHELVLTFIRNAYNGFDEDIRIHADNIINGEKTSLASVLYINNSENITPNGTCFYKHKEYGEKLPISISNEDFDSLLLNDSNDLSKWEITEKITAKPNRQIIYDSNYFHSKWPAKIEKGTRIVLVSFYSKK